MKTVFDHIERVKGQPHHVRKRVAFGTAFAGTAVIALVWLVSSVGTGVFALKDTSFAQSTGGDVPAVSSNNGSHPADSGIAGAAAAPALENGSVPARIQIIDATSTMSVKKAEPTTIPF